jgi:hypothetical protein
MKKIATVGLILFLIALGYGLYMYFAPVKKVSSKATDIVTTEDEILLNFEQSAIYADSIYKNKILEVTGIIHKIEIDSNTVKILFDKQGKFIIVNALSADGIKDAKSLKPDQSVSIKGAYSGYTIIDDMFMIPAEIKLDQCILLSK